MDFRGVIIFGNCLKIVELMMLSGFVFFFYVLELFYSSMVFPY
jgi:hypothetical protein